MQTAESTIGSARGRRRPARKHGIRTGAVAEPTTSAPLQPLIETFIATYGFAWVPRTQRKHRDDFARFTDWLLATGRPVTLDSFAFVTLATFVSELRARPKVHGVWRGTPGSVARATENGEAATLSVNTVNSYVRPLRSFAIWLADEGIHTANPFRKSRRRSAYDPLLPTEETPPKAATLDDLQTLERGCAGERPIDRRDRAIVSILKTTGARNSAVRLLRIADIDLVREVIVFRRGKGAKTLEVALHPEAGRTVLEYLAFGRPGLVDVPLGAEPGPTDVLFPSGRRGSGTRPLTVGALSWMLTRRYRAGGGSLPYFGSHRIRHATATMLVNNGMPLDEVSRYLGHSSTAPTRRYAQQTPTALGVRAADALARSGLVRPDGGGDQW